jgi:t-SNARE complex subunit (syntaxin)
MQVYNNITYDIMVYQDQLIEKRHQEIMKLAQMQLECHELMGHMACLVEEQGFVVDDIRSNIIDASKNVDSGKHSLEKAEDYQKTGTTLGWIMAAITSIAVFTGGILTVSLV